MLPIRCDVLTVLCCTCCAVLQGIYIHTTKNVLIQVRDVFSQVSANTAK
jgi:hypothetical protein